MAAIILATTGTTTSVILNDLGARKFVHPVSNIDLTIEYDLYEITSSADLQVALDNGWITLTSDGNPISLLSDLNMFKSTYDKDSDEIIDFAATASNSLALDGFSSSYYLDAGNLSGTFNGTASNALNLGGQLPAYYLDLSNSTGVLGTSSLSGGTGINYNSVSGELTSNDSQIDHNSLLNYTINEHRSINDASTSLTDLWSASKIQAEVSAAAASGGVTDVNSKTGSVTLGTDDISEGVTNLYFTDQRAKNVISIAAGSSQYMAYSTASGELSVKNLLITDVTTDTSATSSSAYFSANYTGVEFQEGDVVILAGLTGGSEIFIHNGLTGGTASDFTFIDTPHLDDAYIKTLLSGTAPIVYNNVTGDISITQAGVSSDGYLSSADFNTFTNGINGSVQTVNGLTGPTVILDTDNISEGVSNLYHTTLRSRQSISGGTGIGYTSSNGIVYLNANIDQLTDVDTTTVAPVSGDKLQWDGANWVPSASKKTWALQATSNNRNTTNRYLQSDRLFTNSIPLLAHFDCELAAMSISNKGTETWSGILYIDGATASQLYITASNTNFKNTYSGITMSAGSQISMYCSGNNINKPRMQITLKEL